MVPLQVKQLWIDTGLKADGKENVTCTVAKRPRIPKLSHLQNPVMHDTRPLIHKRTVRTSITTDAKK